MIAASPWVSVVVILGDATLTTSIDPTGESPLWSPPYVGEKSVTQPEKSEGVAFMTKEGEQRRRLEASRILDAS